MANFTPKLGLHANLPTVQDGSFLVTTDEKEIYVDTATGRKLISSGKQEIEYIVGTQSAATNAWTGVTKESALYIGKIIAYQLPYEGTNNAATLTLTLAGGSTTDAIGIRRQGTGTVTRHYPANSVIFLVYDGTYWRTDGDYNSEPVSSVNNKTGHVILTAEDVGALPADTVIPEYTGGTGITITTANAINHTNSTTATTAFPTGTSASADGGTITVRDVKYDAQGHITGSQDRTITLSQANSSMATLTIGSYSYNGTSAISIPVYSGTISNTVNYVDGDNLGYGGS